MSHSHFRNRRWSTVVVLLGILMTFVFANAYAANTVVTPSNPDDWAPDDVRFDGTVAITSAQPRSGLGSLEFESIASQDKAGFTKIWSDPTRTLGAVSKVAFEYYRDSSSTAAVHLSPVLRLMFWNDNAPAGPGLEDDRGSLIWEGDYNGINPAPTDSWQPEDVTNEYFWMYLSSGPNTAGGCAKIIQNYQVTLNDWLTTSPTGQPNDCTPPALSSSTYIYGIGTGIGSGWAGTFHGFVDNVELFFGADEITANFEPDPQCTTVCYADSTSGNDANDGITPATAKKTIQAAIDAVNAGGEVRVLPGSYDETATGRDVLGVGSYQFGLFIEETAKDGITIQGVTAADVAITDPTATEAVITTNATNSFGHSGTFVEADDVTIAGLEFGDNNGGNNKTIEIIGDAFTFKDSFMNVSDGGSLYFGDWRFDTVNNASYMLTYTVDNNIFSDGSSVDVTSGAGYSGATAAKLITNNQFEFSLAMYTASGDVSWPNVSFTGNTTTVPWFVHPMTGATITGNTFANNAPDGLHIRARGIADDSTFDWESFWNDNTYNKAVIVGPTLFTTVRSYDYACSSYQCNDVRQIGAVIQPGIDIAVAGDTVLVAPGTYPEQVVITETLQLVGEDGKAVTFIQAPATIPVASNPDSTIVKVAGTGVAAEITGFTIQGPGPKTCGGIGYGIFVRDDAYANIHDNAVVDIKDTGLSGCQNGIAILVGKSGIPTAGTADIVDNMISTYQKGGIVISGAGSDATIERNTVTGDGPITYIAENGIQVSSEATAEINDNTVTGHSYTPSSYGSAGILLFAAGVVNTDNNIVDENEVGIWIIDSSGDHTNNTVTATGTGTGSPYFYGFIVDDPSPTQKPSPADEGLTIGSLLGATADQNGLDSITANPLQTNVISGNTITSDGSSGGYGIETDAGFGDADIDLTVTKNIIHNWEVGVVVYECTANCAPSTFVNVDINRNSIVGNTDHGVYAETLTPITDATCNWWGAADGPSGFGPGTGDAVSDDATYEWWLLSSNLDGPCGPPPESTCSIDAPGVGPYMTDLLGVGQGNEKKGVRTRKLVIPNYGNVSSLYGQLASVESGGVMKYVRFRYPNGTNVQIHAPTSPAYRTFAVNWWGSDLDTGYKYIKGQFFWGAKGNRMPRAFVLWPTYDTGNDLYANAFETFGDSSLNHVAWEAGFIPTQTQILAIPTNLAPVDLTVKIALVDVNKDNRSVILRVEAGGVFEDRTITIPNARDLLNLEEFVLPGVPAGTGEVIITLRSPIPGVEYPFGGDSAAMIGAAANYACVDLGGGDPR